MLTRAVRGGLLLLAAYLALCTTLAAAVSLTRADTGTPWDWLAAGTLLAGLGLHGGVTTTVSGLEPVSGTATVDGTLISLGLLVLAAAFVMARRSERAEPSASTRDAVLRAALSGLTAAAGLALVSAVVRLSPTLYDLGVESHLHPSSERVLLWGGLALSLAHAWGRLRERGAVTLSEAQQRFARSVATALEHVVLSGLLLTLAGIGYLSASSAHEVSAVNQVTGSETGTVIGALLLLPNAMVVATGFFMGMGLGSSGGFSQLGDVSSTVGLLHGDVPAAHWQWALCPLLAAVVVGTRSALRAPAGQAPFAGWLETAAAWVVVWGALLVLVRVGSGGLTVGLAMPSAVVVPVVWGLLTVAAGRVLAVPVAAAVPRLDHRTRNGTADAVRRSLPPKVTALLIATALVAVAGTAGYQVLARTRYSPGIVVEDYLDALERGDVSAAVSHLRLTEQPLVPDERISGGRVTDTHVDGRTASVVASFRVGGLAQTAAFDLTTDGHRAGVFPRWVITNGTARLQVAGPPRRLVVGGTHVLSTETLTTLPGGYRVTVEGKPWLTTAPDPAVFLPGAGLSTSIDLSSTAKAQARTAVESYLADCLARATTLSTSCGVSTTSFLAVTDVHWTLDGEPSLSFQYDSSSDVVRVSSSGGIARVTGMSETGPYRDAVTPQVLGTVTFEGGTPVYAPGF